MKPKLAFFLLLSIGCGSGESPDVSVVNNNTATNNNNSGNGDSQCSFKCEPVQFEGGIGYLVSQECDGQLTNGPEFSPSCPSATSTASTGEAGEFIAEPNEEPIPGLNQDAAL